MGSPITHAKLCLPTLPTEYIPRAHLLSKLEAGGEKKLCSTLNRPVPPESYVWQSGVLWWGHLRRVRPVAVPHLRVGGER